jgi:hypothetical protein
MKRAGLCDSPSNNGEEQEQPAKLQRLDIINTSTPPPANIELPTVNYKSYLFSFPVARILADQVS